MDGVASSSLSRGGGGNNAMRSKKDSWDEEEDKLLIEAHKQVGNKWAEIARRLPGRTENTIKNHWNAAKRKKSSKRQPRKKKNQTYFGESLLERYVKEVTAADAAKKQLKKSMKQLKIKNEDYNLQQNACITGYGGNIPVKFSSNEIGNGSVLIDGTDNYVPMELDMIGIEAYMN
ncbi:transcription factor MYB118 [Arachis stenosperma]|uniref:transcription factor MYB118 n=1 Tax=Arachis stenosperma TaxID=217475 RepID=UPI0025AD6134|nr:transcription factor MYB118 [Arachis stenosperma]